MRRAAIMSRTACLAVCMLACAEDGLPLPVAPDTDASVRVDAGVICPPGRESVELTTTQTFYFGDEVRVAVSDTRETEFAAEVWTSDGGTETTMALPTGSGTAIIPCVADGPYYLRSRVEDLPLYRWTDERSLVVNEPVLGRPDAVAAPPATRLVFSVSNLEPWTDAHELELWTTHDHFVELPSPALGSTRFEGALELSEQGRLLDQRLGDSAALVQVRRTEPAERDVEWSITRSIHWSLTTPGGETTTFAGRAAAPPVVRLTVDLRRSEFRRALSSATQELTDLSLQIRSVPRAASVFAADYDERRYLWWRSWGEADGRYLDTIEVPAVFPDHKAVVVVAGTVGTRRRAIIGAALLSAEVLVGPAEPLVLSPKLSAAMRLEVDGRDATGDLSGVGTTPTVSWDEPSASSNLFYEVFVGPPRVALFHTASPRLRFPPGLLGGGERMSFDVTSYVGAQNGVGSARATVFSGDLTP